MNLLVDSTLKVSFVVLVALGARPLMRHRSAAVRHWVLSVAILCAAAIPLLGMMLPAWSIGPRMLPPAASVAPSESIVSTTSIVSQPNQSSGGTPDAAPPRSLGLRMAGLVGPIWMAGAGISFMVLLTGLAHLAWLASRARPIERGRWATLAKEISSAFHLRRPVVLLESQHPTLLVTWGFVRPKVILPAAARDWSEDRARIVLGHELAHIRRGDWAVLMAAEMLRVVYWFNPLVWLACKRIRQESEYACDDAVLNAGVDGAEYATHLVDLARTLKVNRRWLPAPAMARPSSLEGRVSAMLNAAVNRSPLTRRARVATVIAVLALTMSISGLGAQSFYTLSGSVFDSTNRVLPATRLVLTNTGSQAKHEVRSDRSGHFEFVGLPPGEYGLDVSLPGFRPFKDKIIVVSRSIDRTIQLSVGSLEETITVVGSPGGAADPAPTPDQIEKRQVLRREAEKRQQAALEKCGDAPAGAMGGQILAPIRLANVNPRYPENLRSAGVAGVVTMDAVIGIDGNVQEVRAVTSPHPDLESSAIEAVRQWQFTPTLLNCVPIEVQMKVTTNFKAQP